MDAEASKGRSGRRDLVLWEDATVEGLSSGWLQDRQEGSATSWSLLAATCISSRAHRREELAQCFETLLGSPVRTVEFPGIDQPMLIVSFPGGGHLGIEFTDDAPDDEQPRLGAWLELAAGDPAALLQTALDAGLTEVRHPGHPYYFRSPVARCSPSRQRAERGM